MMTMQEPTAGIDCEKAMRLLWLYLDRALPAAEYAAVDAHIAACAQCRPHTEFERELLSQLAAVRREHEDVPSLRARVLGALRNARLT